jgi:hypothetical protein
MSAPGLLARPLEHRETIGMLYAILCYHNEDVVCSWSKEEDQTVMARLGAVAARLAEAGQLGPSARLLPTTSATTLRKAREPLVIDGPFAETKEQLLGFYVVDVANLDAALGIARELAAANNPGGAYEIRPIASYYPDMRTKGGRGAGA